MLICDVIDKKINELLLLREATAKTVVWDFQIKIRRFELMYGNCLGKDDGQWKHTLLELGRIQS